MAPNIDGHQRLQQERRRGRPLPLLPSFLRWWLSALCAVSRHMTRQAESELV